MKKIIISVFLAICFISFASAAITSINYPHDNDVITHTSRINLNVSSSGSTGCYFTYTSPTGAVAYNQSIICNGVSLVNLPNAEGTYNLTAHDSAASTQTITVTVAKPSGILVTLIYFLTFFVLISMLFLTIINLAKLATFATTIFDIAISLSVYFGLLIAYQLVLEYSAVPFILNWLDLIQSIGGWVMVMLPLISFFVTFVVKGVQKKNLPSVREMTGDLGGYRRYG